MDKPAVKQGSARRRGMSGEKIAARYLGGMGYEILDRNFYTQFGEIDLVVRDPNGAVVFVEVKYRRTTVDGGGVAAVTSRKLARIRLVSGLWLARYRDLYGPAEDIRIDVIDVGPEGVRDHLQGVW
ncbi:YraN family protein [Corynebacterium falsenii]|uniref:YraN family protein n=1 Tax=Corynebacterium falsenii TaxID=108486 RepID=UPI001DDA031F|nr:YraN family protein [Corynebacterium falsenii]HJF11991.1 YraN family protein [Corynebacterium falsenii]